MEALKAKMKSKLNAIKQQHKKDYESAVDTERTERYSERNSTDRTSITQKTELIETTDRASRNTGLSPSPQQIK
jgi:hypothetical protein